MTMTYTATLPGLPLSASRRGQRGSALIVSLLMLLLMSMAAIAGMQTTIMQERMSANLYDRHLAFQAAEAALREAESLLRKSPPKEFNNTAGLYRMNHPSRPDWTAEPVSEGNGAFTYAEGLQGVARHPQYFIEKIDSFLPSGTDTEAGTAVPPMPYFRITARGFGGTPQAVVVVSSVYRNQ